MKDYNDSHRCQSECKNHSCGDNAALGAVPPPPPPHYHLLGSGSPPAPVRRQPSVKQVYLVKERTSAPSRQVPTTVPSLVQGMVPRVCMQTLFCFRLWLRRVRVADAAQGRVFNSLKPHAFSYTVLHPAYTWL